MEQDPNAGLGGMAGMMMPGMMPGMGGIYV